uniref:ORF6C domain-containing protein n=1 Tax=Panagrellus redivivus TaxID=6233 RepID=A0A7E4VMG5_PANRE
MKREYPLMYTMPGNMMFLLQGEKRPVELLDLNGMKYGDVDDYRMCRDYVVHNFSIFSNLGGTFCYEVHEDLIRCRDLSLQIQRHTNMNTAIQSRLIASEQQKQFVEIELEKAEVARLSRISNDADNQLAKLREINQALAACCQGLADAEFDSFENDIKKIEDLSVVLIKQRDILVLLAQRFFKIEAFRTGREIYRWMRKKLNPPMKYRYRRYEAIKQAFDGQMHYLSVGRRLAYSFLLDDMVREGNQLIHDFDMADGLYVPDGSEPIVVEMITAVANEYNTDLMLS